MPTQEQKTNRLIVVYAALWIAVTTYGLIKRVNRWRFWGLMTALTVVWIAVIVRKEQRKRLNKTTPYRCSACDYDLSGTIAANRELCPECGKVIDDEDRHDNEIECE